MCENGIWLVAEHVADKVMRVMRTNCDMWTCEECAERKSRYWRTRAMRGVWWLRENRNEDTWVFMTLTAHRYRRGLDRTIQDWREKWPRLYAKMKRVQPVLSYIMIAEQHKDASMHVHTIINWRGEGYEFTRAKYDKSGKKRTKWRTKDEAASVGLGFEADVKPLTDERQAGAYVTKYLTKTLGNGTQWPKFHRLIRASQDFPDIPAYQPDLSDYVWHTLGSEGLTEFGEAVYENMGYTILDGWTNQLYNRHDYDDYED